MLENEPTGAVSADPNAAADEVRTVEAAPTRRRRAASRPAGPAGSPAANDGEPAAAAAAPAAEPEPAAVKRTRRTTKKAVAEAAPTEPVTAESGTERAAAAPRRRTKAVVAPAVADGESAAAQPAAAEPAAVPPKKTPARRTTKKVAAATAEPSAAEPSAAATAEPSAADRVETESVIPRGAAAPLVLFQPPAPVAAPRRRTRKAAVTEPVDDETTTTAEQAGQPADSAEGAPEPEALVTGPATDASDDDLDNEGRRRRRRRGGRGRRRRSSDDIDDGSTEADAADAVTPDAKAQPEVDGHADDDGHVDAGERAEGEHNGDAEVEGGTHRRRRRRRRGSGGDEASPDDPLHTVVRVREPRSNDRDGEVTSVRGSTRLEAKKQRRREGREAGRRRPPVISEAEFLARREAVSRVMVTRQVGQRTQIAVLEDGVLVEHYVNRETNTSYVGNVYLGRVQNVLPSMEAAFVDIGKGRNAVLYAGEVNWDAAGMEGQPKRIEQALKSGDTVLVQVTKDPIGHKGARLTSQISLPGRYLVYVPGNSMTGISRKLPDTERARLKKILKKVVPDDAGVIVRTAAEGASEEELARDVARLQAQWADIDAKSGASTSGPVLLYGEPDLAVRVIRDVFNEDFTEVVVSGDDAWDTIEAYVGHVAPDLVGRLRRWTSDEDVFSHYRVDEQLAKALDRKVWLPSGGSLVIDRTEAMVVIDVNTGKFTGKGGNLEETVTKNNLEAAEEIVRQLRLRDLGGIIVIDFIDMVLESNRELVMRRLVECLGRDRTRHQVAEVTSLGLVQMTRKRIGQGLLEAFSTPCEACNGRGVKVSMDLAGSHRPAGRKSASTPAVVFAPSPVPSAPAPSPTPVLAPVPRQVEAEEPAPAPAAAPAGEATAPAGEATAPAGEATAPTFAPRGLDLHDGESAYPARRRGRRRATSPAGAPRTDSGSDDSAGEADPG